MKGLKNDFVRNILWTFEDIHMLVGSNMPIFGGGRYPAVSLRLRWGLNLMKSMGQACWTWWFASCLSLCILCEWLLVFTCSLKNKIHALGLKDDIQENRNSSSAVRFFKPNKDTRFLQVFCFIFSLWNLNTSTAFLTISLLCSHFAKYIYIYIVFIYYKYILYLPTNRCMHYKKKSKLLHKLCILYICIYVHLYMCL